MEDACLVRKSWILPSASPLTNFISSSQICHNIELLTPKQHLFVSPIFHCFFHRLYLRFTMTQFSPTALLSFSHSLLFLSYWHSNRFGGRRGRGGVRGQGQGPTVRQFRWQRRRRGTSVGKETQGQEIQGFGQVQDAKPTTSLYVVTSKIIFGCVPIIFLGLQFPAEERQETHPKKSENQATRGGSRPPSGNQPRV